MPSVAAVLATLGVLFMGCGGDDAPDARADGGSDVDATIMLDWLADGQPSIAAPVLTPCPEGWREVAEAGVAVCEPWPEGGPADCPSDQAHFPGEPGCQPIGTECPAGDFADDLPTDAVVYVKEGVVDGDGSRAAPFGSLAEAGIRSLPTGTTVALAAGTYPGLLPLNAGVSVVGACVRDTILVGEDLPVSGVVTVAGRGETPRLTNVTISEPPVPAVVVNGGMQSIELEGVLVERAPGMALRAILSGTLTARSVVVRDTALDTGGHLGVAVECLDGTVELERAVFERNHTAGIVVGLPNGFVRASRIAIHDTEADGVSMEFGRSLAVQLGARAEISAAVFEREREAAVLVGGEDAIAVMEDVVIRDGRPRASDDSMGRAIDVALGGRLEGRRLRIHNVRDAGILVAVGPSHIELEDAVISQVLEQRNDGRRGTGLLVQQGASAHAARLLVDEFREVGLLVGLEEASLDAEDLIVRNGRSRELDGKVGRGLGAQDDARVSIRRALFEDNRDVGVLSIHGSEVTLEDVAVRATLPQACADTTCTEEPLGYGLGAVSAVLSATRFRVSDSSLCGAFLADDGAMDLSTGEIVDGAIGACVQVDDYDFGRLQRSVSYRENGLNLESTMLPTPVVAGEPAP